MILFFSNLVFAENYTGAFTASEATDLVEKAEEMCSCVGMDVSQYKGTGVYCFQLTQDDRDLDPDCTEYNDTITQCFSAPDAQQECDCLTLLENLLIETNKINQKYTGTDIDGYEILDMFSVIREEVCSGTPIEDVVIDPVTTTAINDTPTQPVTTTGSTTRPDTVSADRETTSASKDDDKDEEEDKDEDKKKKKSSSSMPCMPQLLGLFGIIGAGLLIFKK